MSVSASDSGSGSTPVRQRIQHLLEQHRVVLFMKGLPQAPRCGFSSRAVQLLGSVVSDYHAVDVLADEAIRQGIKDYGNWPTIPQLYIDGELIGGSDILAQMFGSGELHQMLGVAPPDRTPPTIEITTQAAQAIAAGMADDPELALHLQIDAGWQAQFQLAPASGDEIVASAQGIRVHMDPLTAQRARGMRIDWVDTARSSGLSVFLPEAPAAVAPLQVEGLRDALAAGQIQVVDVRPAADRARAPFAGAWVWETDQARLQALPKDTALAFLCHHGISSRAVAEQFRAWGFGRVHNVEGGIDAWSQRVDSAVPRY